MFKKIFGSIFGSSDNTKTVVDGAVNGLDKMFYTDEERAETAGEMRKWFITYLNASNPQNVSRRFIAIVVTLLWAFLVLIGIAAFAIEYFFFYDPAAEFSAVMAAFIFRVLTDIVAVPFAGIMAFYFVTHLARGIKRDG